MNKPLAPQLDEYLVEADSWARERSASQRSMLRLYQRVAAGLGAVALLEGIALVALAPLKTVVPYTVLVDRHTGYVQALKPLDQQVIAPDAALTQSFLAQYVTAREEFDISSLQSDYRKVALWSASTARNGYVASMQASSSESPLSRYPRTAIIQVQIKSVASLAANTALVRFDTVRADSGIVAPARQSWMAVLSYDYSAGAMSMDDRLINPLGFKVTRYRKSLETAPPADAEVTTMVTRQDSLVSTSGSAAAVPSVALPTQESGALSQTTVTRALTSGAGR